MSFSRMFPPVARPIKIILSPFFIVASKQVQKQRTVFVRFFGTCLYIRENTYIQGYLGLADWILENGNWMAGTLK
jgi:hypothetical protein